MVQTVTQKASALSKPETKAQTAQIKGKASKNIINKYTAELKAFLDQNKVYPRMAARLRQSGIVKVKVSIDSKGVFNDVKVVSPAPFDSLNSSTVSLLKSLGKFKPLPKEFYPKEDFIIPIVYKLTGRFR